MAATSSRIRSLRAPSSAHRRSCACSPTTHPGSYRCSDHKIVVPQRPIAVSPSQTQIGLLSGDWARRVLVLAALSRPSSHLNHRKAVFQPRPSRLSSVSSADDL
ncbi:uncharacterized protein LOC120279633 [Dioscorea cayenensis subsp. rotundata]|uniref:Uncharacterized protein LOC120279633 n=1 Tax=Dioscorea cayennensis subsp. rotundata TaxID=55577 RepID=A0AB40CR19_DIOCR|nr:uncharacterized protein LOC120279633 [Dioscorea cayenensis subsp. rotundata]